MRDSEFDASGIVLCRMKESDLPEVLHIERHAYSHPWTENNFRDSLKSKNDCFMLRSEEGEILGYGIMYVAVGEAHLLNLCIAESQQGKGLGKYLLQVLCDNAEKQQAEAFFLEVRESNQAAIRLYETFGFNQVGLRKNYYPSATGREHAVLMAKTLCLP